LIQVRGVRGRLSAAAARVGAGDIEIAQDHVAEIALAAGVPFLQAAINRFVIETNNDPKPFTWTTKPRKILAVRQSRAPSVRFDLLSLS
jgi:hypothetical protein